MPLNRPKQAFSALNLQVSGVLKAALVLNMLFIEDLVFVLSFKKGTGKAMVCLCCVCIVCVLYLLVCGSVLLIDLVWKCFIFDCVYE